MLIWAAAAFVHTNDSHSALRAAAQYVDLLQQSGEQYQDALRQLWKQSNMEQAIAPLDVLIAKLNEAVGGPSTMYELVNRLNDLDDQQAIDLFHVLALSDPDFADHSKDLISLSRLQITTEQQADLVRETLLVLAEQYSARAEAIDSMLIHPPARSFEGGMTMATLVGVAVLLRTHIKFKRNPQGNWELLIEHKPASNSLLNRLIKKIQTLLEQQ